MNGAAPFFGAFDYVPEELLYTALFVLWVILLIYLLWKTRQWRRNVK